MRKFKDYIKEEKNDVTSGIKRGDIKFTIWKAPDQKVTKLDDDEPFQKIEYKLEDKELSIDFLLGTQDGSWKLWIGKIGSCSYDDDPYCDFETSSFKKAIIACLDKVEEFIKKVKEDEHNYIQYYIHK